MENYEEKYKLSFERAKAYFHSDGNYNDYTDKMLLEIFPELKESDDERIRRELLEHCINRRDGKQICVDASDYRRWAAWLEKQKCLTTDEDKQGKEDVLWCIEQARKNAKDENDMGTCWFAEKWLEKQGESIKIKKGKNYLCTKTHKYAGVEWREGIRYYSPEDYSLVNQGCTCYCPKYSKEEHNNFFKEVEYDGCLEKQGEQKPIIIIPQFKVGDTIKPKPYNEEHLIKDINENGYVLDVDIIIPFKDEDVWEIVAQNLAWSEEDEKIINTIISDITRIYMSCGVGTEEYNIRMKALNWPKSIKPNHWKPSEEQMESLKIARDYYMTGKIKLIGKDLDKIYQQLKKP